MPADGGARIAPACRRRETLRHLARKEGPIDEIALDDVAAEVAQEMELFDGFGSLR